MSGPDRRPFFPTAAALNEALLQSGGDRLLEEFTRAAKGWDAWTCAILAGVCLDRLATLSGAKGRRK